MIEQLLLYIVVVVARPAAAAFPIAFVFHLQISFIFFTDCLVCVRIYLLSTLASMAASSIFFLPWIRLRISPPPHSTAKKKKLQIMDCDAL
jgi:hypothetical protein